MRLFIAISLPLFLIDYLRELQKHMSSSFQKTTHLHVTLKFLGEVTPENTNLVIERLSTIHFKSFDLTLHDIGVFPSAKYPRIIWVGVKPAEPILHLQQLIESRLSDLFESEQHFHPHITVARTKEKTFAHSIKPHSFTVSGFDLIQSGPQPGKYTVLQRFPSKDL